MTLLQPLISPQKWRECRLCVCSRVCKLQLSLCKQEDTKFQHFIEQVSYVFVKQTDIKDEQVVKHG